MTALGDLESFAGTNSTQNATCMLLQLSNPDSLHVRQRSTYAELGEQGERRNQGSGKVVDGACASARSPTKTGGPPALPAMIFQLGCGCEASAGSVDGSSAVGWNGRFIRLQPSVGDFAVALGNIQSKDVPRQTADVRRDT